MDAGSILIVGGDPGSREQLAELACRLGHGVHAVADARAALDHVAAASPRLVLLDVDRGALELCHELVDLLGARTPVIIVSAERATPEDCVAGLLAGADDYLAKPFDAGELLARMRRSIARSSPARPPVADAHLTPREQEILDLLVAGDTEREIARRLVISTKTVATHIQHILTKLGVHSRAQAIACVANGRRPTGRT